VRNPVDARSDQWSSSSQAAAANIAANPSPMEDQVSGSIEAAESSRETLLNFAKLLIWRIRDLPDSIEGGLVRRVQHLEWLAVLDCHSYLLSSGSILLNVCDLGCQGR
jgi:hypothetical protein